MIMHSVWLGAEVEWLVGWMGRSGFLISSSSPSSCAWDSACSPREVLRYNQSLALTGGEG